MHPSKSSLAVLATSLVLVSAGCALTGEDDAIADEEIAVTNDALAGRRIPDGHYVTSVGTTPRADKLTMLELRSTGELSYVRVRQDCTEKGCASVTERGLAEPRYNARLDRNVLVFFAKDGRVRDRYLYTVRGSGAKREITFEKDDLTFRMRPI